MTAQTYTVWAVACHGVCDGWNAGTVEDDKGAFADVYASKTEAEQELADMVRERLTQFIDDPETYDDLETALDTGFIVRPAVLHANGTVSIEGQMIGRAPPAVIAALKTATPA